MKARTGVLFTLFLILCAGRTLLEVKAYDWSNDDRQYCSSCHEFEKQFYDFYYPKIRSTIRHCLNCDNCGDKKICCACDQSDCVVTCGGGSRIKNYIHHKENLLVANSVSAGHLWSRTIGIEEEDEANEAKAKDKVDKVDKVDKAIDKAIEAIVKTQSELANVRRKLWHQNNTYYLRKLYEGTEARKADQLVEHRASFRWLAQVEPDGALFRWLVQVEPDGPAQVGDRATARLADRDFSAQPDEPAEYERTLKLLKAEQKFQQYHLDYSKQKIQQLLNCCSRPEESAHEKIKASSLDTEVHVKKLGVSFPPTAANSQEAAHTNFSERQGSKLREKALTGLTSTCLIVVFLAFFALYMRWRRRETIYSKGLLGMTDE